MLHYLKSGIKGLISSINGVTNLTDTSDKLSGLLNGDPLEVIVNDNMDNIKVSVTYGRITRFLTHENELELLSLTSLTIDKLVQLN